MEAAKHIHQKFRIRPAKRNPVRGTKTFYVSSARDARHNYIVQRVSRGRKTTFFCECRDFICRKLPHLATNTFSGCKHIAVLRRRLAA